MLETTADSKERFKRTFLLGFETISSDEGDVPRGVEGAREGRARVEGATVRQYSSCSLQGWW